MGNTESKLVDIGLRIVCKFSGGMLGKSDDGYHIGPLRLKKDSFGIKYSSGIWNAEFKISKSGSGGWTPKIGFGIGIPGKLELKIQAEKTKEGFNVSPSFSVDAGPFHAHGEVTIDQDFTFQNKSIGVDGPVSFEYKHTKDSDESDGKGTSKHTNDSKGQTASQFKAGIQVGPLKTFTTIDLKDGLDFDNVMKNWEYEIDSDYIAKKAHEIYKANKCEKEEEKKEGERNDSEDTDEKAKVEIEVMPVKKTHEIYEANTCEKEEEKKEGERNDSKDTDEKAKVEIEVMPVKKIHEIYEANTCEKEEEKKEGERNDTKDTNEKAKVEIEVMPVKKTHEIYKANTCEKEEEKKEEMPNKNKTKGTKLGERTDSRDTDEKAKVEIDVKPVKNQIKEMKQSDTLLYSLRPQVTHGETSDFICILL